MAKSRKEFGDWSQMPQEPTVERAWPILRVGPKGVSGLVIVSSYLLGRYTHYHRGRTCPCTGDHCTACRSGQRNRWYGWLACMSIKSRSKAIVEITQAGFSTQAEKLKSMIPIRGWELAIQRIPAVQNGKMRLDLQERRELPFELPVEPDIRAILERMWEHNSDLKKDVPWSEEAAEEHEKREREEVALMFHSNGKRK